MCRGHWAHYGNAAAAQGWLARARRLVDGHDLDPLRGWIHVHGAMLADPAAGEPQARKAHELAQLQGDIDLELYALSELGANLIGQGRVTEGLDYLDEAMAGALGGEADDGGTVVYACCVTLKSCASCAGFERAVQWVRAADRFVERYGNPFLYAQCRALYGSVLVATGEWEQAEQELHTAERLSRDSLPTVHGSATAALAELRLAQGRLDEADRIVTGLDEQPDTVAIIARTHLVRGRYDDAETILHRWLATLDAAELQRLLLLELLGELELAKGRPDAAQQQAGELVEAGTTLGCELAVARGERLAGRALVAAAQPDAARTHLDAALVAFTSLGIPLEAARTRLLLAEALHHHAPDTAITEARAALTTFDELGATHDADAAAGWLRNLGAKAPRTGPRTQQTLTRREREVLELLRQGLSNPEIAERLYISRRTVEEHVANVLTKLGVRNRTEAATATPEPIEDESEP